VVYWLTSLTSEAPLSGQLDSPSIPAASADEAERAAADPIACIRAQRAGRTLWGRLMHGRR
jgi:hypothetical protein